MDDPKPMYVERDEQNDVVMYYVLCPKCKQYNSLNPRWHSEKLALDGEGRFWCKSVNCNGKVLLEIVRGRAVIVNNYPKPDVKAPEPDVKSPRLWTGISPGNFPLPRNSQN